MQTWLCVCVCVHNVFFLSGCLYNFCLTFRNFTSICLRCGSFFSFIFSGCSFDQTFFWSFCFGLLLLYLLCLHCEEWIKIFSSFLFPIVSLFRLGSSLIPSLIYRFFIYASSAFGRYPWCKLDFSRPWAIFSSFTL